MKYWVRDNKVEAGLIASIGTFLLVTVVAAIWTMASGEVHTGWEVLAYFIVGILAIGLAAFVFGGFATVVVFPVGKMILAITEKHEERKNQYVGKHVKRTLVIRKRTNYVGKHERA